MFVRQIANVVKVDDLAGCVRVVGAWRESVGHEVQNFEVIDAGEPCVRCPPWSRRIARIVSPASS